MTPLLLVSSAALTGALILSDRPEGTDCRAVEGSIAARITDVDVTMRGLRASGAGNSSGDLAGPVSLEARRGIGGTGFQLELQIHTRDGVVHLAGRATASDDPAAGEGARRLDGRLTVGSGTRGFARAAGSLDARGVARIDERTATVAYSGSVCGLAPAAGR